MTEDILKCHRCNKPASLVDDNWVCHHCKIFIAKKPEIYSRVVGYIRPVDQWNKGKQQEFKDRKEFEI
uniref:Putative anaerobic ribonucleoside-triphosphate reductase n=1 Tax=viral metagenome TaxID=1070528 RepID=A0A6M3KYW1_9ZZZZ